MDIEVKAVFEYGFICYDLLIVLELGFLRFQ